MIESAITRDPAKSHIARRNTEAQPLRQGRIDDAVKKEALVNDERLLKIVMGGWLFLHVGRNLHADDLVGIVHLAALRVALLDGVNMFHAGNHAAPDRIFTVQERRCL